MSQYYTIQITGGTSTGPYSIYYDLVSSGNFANLYPSNTIASGLSLSTLTTGVIVEVPDTTTNILLYNQLCKQSKIFSVAPTPQNYGYLCIRISLQKTTTYQDIEVQYVGNFVNGKPQYVGSSYSVQWNSTNNYWELIGFSGFNNDNVIFRSIDNDFIPDTNWSAYGTFASNYAIVVNPTQCFLGKGGPQNLLSIQTDDPTCSNSSDGSIFVTGIGSSGWTYSLDGILYTNSTGLFTGLNSGPYTVYGKDYQDTVTSDVVNLNASTTTYITIPGSVTVTNISQVGNIWYYMVDIIYDTTSIPVGETVTFDYKFIYNLIYKEPGTVSFDTNQHYVIKNGVNQTINQTAVTPLTQVSPLPCNPTLYYEYNGSVTYVSYGISLVNGDTFESQIIYGIDVSAGGFLDGCVTEGSVNVNTIFENVILTCQCCNFTGSQINNVGLPQIPQF
jgi:hypothetical protein